jgi:hypothetical protein
MPLEYAPRAIDLPDLGFIPPACSSNRGGARCSTVQRDRRFADTARRCRWKDWRSLSGAMKSRAAPTLPHDGDAAGTTAGGRGAGQLRRRGAGGHAGLFGTAAGVGLCAPVLPRAAARFCPNRCHRLASRDSRAGPWCPAVLVRWGGHDVAQLVVRDVPRRRRPASRARRSIDPPAIAILCCLPTVPAAYARQMRERSRRLIYFTPLNCEFNTGSWSFGQ